MRYFKLINDEGWGLKTLKKDIVYPGYYKDEPGISCDVEYYATKGRCLADWIEVSKEEFIKQNKMEDKKLDNKVPKK